MFCYVILFKWCYLLVVSRVKKVISVTHYWLPGSWKFYISAKPRITSYVMQELIWWESKFSLRKILSFHLNYWCGNFAERPSFHIGLGNSPETMQKLCFSTKRPHQEIRWNGGIFRSVLKWPTVCLINVFLLLVLYPQTLQFMRGSIIFSSATYQSRIYDSVKHLW